MHRRPTTPTGSRLSPMATDTWDPRQYDKFQREREQPFYDLLAMIRPGNGMRIVDLGCGTGKLTRVLHETLQARETIGIDRSASMLAASREAPAVDGLRFEEGTIEAFAGRGKSGKKDTRLAQKTGTPDVISRTRRSTGWTTTRR